MRSTARVSYLTTFTDAVESSDDLVDFVNFCISGPQNDALALMVKKPQAA